MQEYRNTPYDTQYNTQIPTYLQLNYTQNMQTQPLNHVMATNLNADDEFVSNQNSNNKLINCITFMFNFKWLNHAIEIMTVKLIVSLISMYITLLSFLIYIGHLKNNNVTTLLLYNAKIAMLMPIGALSFICICYMLSYCKKIYTNTDVELDKSEFYWCWIRIFVILWRDVHKLIFAVSGIFSELFSHCVKIKTWSKTYIDIADNILLEI